MLKTGLLPRNNWDYTMVDLLKAFSGSLSGNIPAEGHFEKMFGRKPVFTRSGRTSLYAILRSLDLPAGAGIGVPLFCCDIVFDTITKANLRPVFIDIDTDDYNISAVDLKKKIGSLAALVVVHMFGQPADMDAIRSVCGQVPIIEDCAHSLLSTYKGEYTGSLSTASFFSFRSGKYISAGEGSAVFASNASLDASIRKCVEQFEVCNLRQELLHSASTYIKSTLYHRPWYGLIGYPIGKKLDQKLNLTAKSGFSTGRIRKSDLGIIADRITTFHRKIQQQRENSLYLLDKVRMNDVFLPHEKKDRFSNYYQFAIRFKQPERRDIVSDALFARGIDTARYLSNIADIAKHSYGYDGSCLNAELCARSTLVIPNHYTLSRADLDNIVSSLNFAEAVGS